MKIDFNFERVDIYKTAEIDMRPIYSMRVGDYMFILVNKYYYWKKVEKRVSHERSATIYVIDNNNRGLYVTGTHDSGMNAFIDLIERYPKKHFPKKFDEAFNEEAQLSKIKARDNEIK